jgi:predicted amidohydrolase
MKKQLVIIPLLAIFLQSHAQNLVPNAGFEVSDKTGMPDGWTYSAPREEISPVFSIDNTVSRSGKNSAMIRAAGSPGTYGLWSVRFTGTEGKRSDFKPLNTMPDSLFLGGRTYLVGCYYRTSGIDAGKHVRIKVTWTDTNGNELLTEFLKGSSEKDGWLHTSGIRTAPLNTAGISISLILQWTDKGTVWWDDIYVREAPAPQPRPVNLAAASSRPGYKSTTEKNLEFYSDVIAKAGKAGADILCLGEGITVVSTGRSYVDVSETIPGPATKILGEAAKKAGIYVVAGIYEREGSLVYNTAILIDRQGNVAGKYRKTHLPQTEVEGGLTPGSEYPVFQTDFGKIGIEICYDNFFPEVVRNLVKNGAEIIFCPIWGDIRGFSTEWDIVARARAIDNAVHFVASMYEKEGSIIIDPDGKILSRSTGSGDFIISKTDLGKRTFERWLSNKSFGEWKNLFPNEMRPETY